MKVFVMAALLLCALPGAARAAVFASEFAPGQCIEAGAKQVTLAKCEGGARQDFGFTGYGPVTLGKACLEAQGDGRALAMGACRAASAQRWAYDHITHQFKNEQGLCVSIEGERRNAGAALKSGKCSGLGSQRWARPADSWPMSTGAGPAR
jgi:hypothetical protein